MIFIMKLRFILGKIGIFWYSFNFVLFLVSIFTLLFLLSTDSLRAESMVSSITTNLFITGFLFLLSTRIFLMSRKDRSIILHKTLSFQILGFAGLLYVTLIYLIVYPLIKTDFF